jgi:hypothetical protein
VRQEKRHYDLRLRGGGVASRLASHIGSNETRLTTAAGRASGHGGPESGTAATVLPGAGFGAVPEVGAS